MKKKKTIKKLSCNFKIKIKTKDPPIQDIMLNGNPILSIKEIN